MNSKPANGRRWLLVRMDRIGDLVLTLPVDEVLQGEKTWWISRGLTFITQNAAPPRDALELERKISFSAFFKLLREVKDQHFTDALVFHGPWWVSLMIWLAGIPERAGVKSQWHSFLFLNRAVRQKRSRGECSELEYAYQLVESSQGLKAGSLKRNSLLLNGARDATDFLAQRGLIEGGYSVVHPGMGGSALNWPTARYAELIQTLTRDRAIVVTGTPSDEPYLKPLRELLKGKTGIIWLDGQLSATELLTLLQSARSVIAPSTGVVHLAASVSAPTVGLYSPVRVQHPRRWGPQGARVRSLLPKVDCPGEMACLGAKCPHFDCMEKITVTDVMAAMTDLETL